jgi:hypothetical protein
LGYPFNITGSIIYDDNKPTPPPFVVHDWDPANDVTFEALDDKRLLRDADKTISLDFNFGFDALGIPR